jgi:hypothetical protein
VLDAREEGREMSGTSEAKIQVSQLKRPALRRFIQRKSRAFEGGVIELALQTSQRWR